MVGKWRKRFVKVEGLHDELSPGAPHKVSDAQVEMSRFRVKWNLSVFR